MLGQLPAITREVEAGRFRTELYHRLNVVPVAVPGLEARREDIPDLAKKFLEDLNGTQNLPQRALAAEAEAAARPYAGRAAFASSKNTLEQALILGPDHGPVEPEELVLDTPSNILRQRHAPAPRPPASRCARGARMFEREYLVAQINRFGGNISRTANFVRMERSALSPSSR